MSGLTLTKPYKEKGKNGVYIVYIVKNELVTGVEGRGETPQKAIRNAQAKIEKGEGELQD